MPATCFFQDFKTPNYAAEVALTVCGTRQLTYEKLAKLSMQELRDYARMVDVQPKRMRNIELQDLVVWTCCHFLSNSAQSRSL